MRLKRFWVPLIFLLGMYFDAIFFARVNFYGIHPDVLIAAMVSYGVLMGGLPASILGCLLGLYMDVMFGKVIGLTAISYMTAGYAGGLFFQKFYADNTVIPAVTAASGQFLQEHIMAAAMALRGGSFPYLLTLTTHILPCALATGLLCIPLHLLMRYALEQQTRLRGSETHHG
ncbi:MAG: rod shape-determining protein MreD [Eubacteriales bacterium]|nr:rod shape-determining protein MreD [Eubacteriales bacterium]